jgi:integrase
MGNQRTSGVTKRGGIWHIDKQFRGARNCESTGTGDIGQAEEYLARRVVELRETKLYGARELRSFRSAAEVCGLKWDYEVKVPELDTSVFIIPGERIKNGEERLVALNGIAKSVIESVRGLHSVDVFVRAHKKSGEPRPVTKMNNTAWRAARERAADT